MKKHWPILLILMLSIAVHFAYFGHPKQTVFDEVHFGKFISGYFTHEYFFDIHPPLGKLIMSGAGEIAGFQPGFSFGKIGDSFPDRTYLALRLLPAIAGTLLPLVIYLLVLELGMSRVAALSAGLLIIFENALVAQSRFMLLDALLLLFGFLAWLFYAKSLKLPARTLQAGGHATRYTILAALFGGFALSVKWTGATFLGIIGILELIRLFREWSMRRVGTLAILVVIPAILYFSIFALHFSLLYKSGPGDAFMSQSFRKTLAGSSDAQNPDIVPASLFGKFIELNQEMYRSNARLTAPHPYSSKWYTWPFMLRSIYYWNSAGAKIYLIGNPIIWWVSTFAIFYVLLSTLGTKKIALYLISGAYLVNILPFIGIDRAMFLYHYFTGLIIAILALAYLIDHLQHRKKIFAGLIALSIAMFLYFAPLTYGTPELTQKQFDRRMWLKSWL